MLLINVPSGAASRVAQGNGRIPGTIVADGRRFPHWFLPLNKGWTELVRQ